MNFRQLLVAPRAQHGVGVSPTTVAAARAAVGPLPADYCRFLTVVGWATVGHHEVAGLGDDLPHRWQSVVDLTVQERTDGGLPDHLVAICPDGGGNFVCLDGDRVVWWFHDDPVVEPLAPSFGQWLSTLKGT